MAHYAQHAVFGKRTSRPSFLTFRLKPLVRPVMLNVSRVDQSDQYVDIQKKPAQGNSSRSRWTNSEVTRSAPLRIGRSGTPLRVLEIDSPGDSARLAKDEITSPIDLFSIAAISLAALKISSSMTRVVRIASPIIKHHTSDALVSTRPRRFEIIGSSPVWPPRSIFPRAASLPARFSPRYCKTFPWAGSPKDGSRGCSDGAPRRSVLQTSCSYPGCRIRRPVRRSVPSTVRPFRADTSSVPGWHWHSWS